MKYLDGPKFGAFWGAFWRGFERFWGRFRTWEAPFGRSEVNLDKSALKRRAAEISLSPSGQKNDSGKLAGRCPGHPKIGLKDAKERKKRLCEEKIVKTSKTSTLSSEMRGLGGREGPKILKNRPRSGLEGLKSSIVI